MIAHARGFASEVAQVEEAGPTNDALADDFYFLDSGRMREKNALDPDVEADLANRKRAAGAGAMPFDDDALKYLRSFFVAFDDAVVNPHAVADAKVGEVGTEVGRLQLG